MARLVFVFPGFKFSVKVEEGPKNHLQVKTNISFFSSCQTSTDYISISIFPKVVPFLRSRHIHICIYVSGKKRIES